MGFPRFDGSRWWSLSEVHAHLEASAHAAAERGWPVFPLRWFSKVPAVADWPHRASRDHDQIRRWWAEAPYNIGIATGAAGLVVVDLDRPTGLVLPPPWPARGCRHGRDVLAWQAAQAGQPDPTVTYTVASAGSGEHLYFAAPPGAGLPNSVGSAATGLGPAVDIRAHGGAITAAGSVLILRRRLAFYTLLREAPVAALPGWVHSRLRPPAPPAILLPRTASVAGASFGDGAVREASRRITGAQPGTRAATVFAVARWIGNRIAQGYCGDAAARSDLEDACRVLVSHSCGFSEAEALRNLRRGLDIGIAEGPSLRLPA